MLLLSQITFFIDIYYAISRIILYHLNYQFQQRPNVLEVVLVIRNQGHADRQLVSPGVRIGDKYTIPNGTQVAQAHKCISSRISGLCPLAAAAHRRLRGPQHHGVIATEVGLLPALNGETRLIGVSAPVAGSML